MVMLGATPPGRFTEQHDIFFGIGNSLKDLVPHMQDFWPEALGKIHIDAWREVSHVDGFEISVVPKESVPHRQHLFFINLGGYRENEFEEYHYKVLAVGKTLAEASKKSKQTAFYKHYSFKGAESHIDDKFGIDVDDIYKVEDMLPGAFRENYALRINPSPDVRADKLHIGYVKIEKLLKK
ncbi:DUF1543 domain-containing protein [Flavobacterium magnum]|uniref:DUF1543 domain-containing protein n=2 Tax=Flavobacterium magnum TaxID=2162713 RepID=A0A2S0RIR1_9FLAO|nr:DUF1543 domain-containing protein [Flavobacterium magnum]